MYMERRKIKWEAPEHAHREKGNDWFWALGIIALAASFASVIMGNVLLGLLIIISAFVLALHANKEPRIMEIEIRESSVRVDKRVYPYNNLESFGINMDNEEEPVLIFKSEKMLMPYISVFVDLEDVEEVRDYLSERLPEEDHDVGLIQRLVDFLGF